MLPQILLLPAPRSCTPDWPRCIKQPSRRGCRAEITLTARQVRQQPDTHSFTAALAGHTQTRFGWQRQPGHRKAENKGQLEIHLAANHLHYCGPRGQQFRQISCEKQNILTGKTENRHPVDLAANTRQINWGASSWKNCPNPPRIGMLSLRYLKVKEDSGWSSYDSVQPSNGRFDRTCGFDVIRVRVSSSIIQ